MLLIIFWTMLLGPSALGEVCAGTYVRTCECMREKGPNFFFTDRVSLTPNFLSLYEEVPRASLGKV